MALRLLGAAFVAALVLGLALMGSSGSASAHERRVVANNYLLVVGWLNEPTLAGQPNALSLEITLFPNGVPENAGTEATEGQDLGGTKVEGAEKTLKASITVGGGAQTKELTLEPRFGEPGAYNGVVIPRIPGDYTFDITGSLDSTPINEKFESGPDTFATVEDPATLEFPAVPSASPSPVATSNNGSDDTGTAALVVAIVAAVLAVGAGGIGLFAVSKARTT